MKAKKNIFAFLEIASILLGAIIVVLSFVPGILHLYYNVAFSFNVANFFLFGFLIGSGIMVLAFILFEYLDEKTN